jgi:hypothetical protein
MVYILLLTLQIGDSIEPSYRIKALGEDLAFMIEDFTTDIQLFPSHLAFSEGTELYIRSGGGPYWVNMPPIQIGIFSYPVTRNLGFGLIGSYFQSQYSDSQQTENGSSGSISAYSYIHNQPSGNFFWCIPFIKDGGFLGVKVNLYRPHQKDDRMSSGWSADTSTSVNDTIINSSFSHAHNYLSNDRLPWGITLNQYLPLNRSTFDFSLNFGMGREQDTIADIDTNYTYWADIFHSGTVRNVYITTYRDRSSLSTLQTIDITRGGGGFVWTGFPPIGEVKIYGGISLNRSQGRNDIIGDFYGYDIHRTEYADSDTAYVIVDTIYYNDSSSVSVIETKTVEDNEILGLALTRTTEGRFSLFTGILGKRSRSDANQKGADTTQIIVTNYRIALPIAGEFFVTPSFCLRAGIKAMYENNSTETKDVVYNITHYDIFRFSRTCGIGFNLDKRLNFDLYVDSDNLTSWKAWGLEAMYRF